MAIILKASKGIFCFKKNQVERLVGTHPNSEEVGMNVYFFLVCPCICVYGICVYLYVWYFHLLD